MYSHVDAGGLLGFVIALCCQHRGLWRLEASRHGRGSARMRARGLASGRAWTRELVGARAGIGGGGAEKRRIPLFTLNPFRHWEWKSMNIVDETDKH